MVDVRSQRGTSGTYSRILQACQSFPIDYLWFHFRSTECRSKPLTVNRFSGQFMETMQTNRQTLRHQNQNGTENIDDDFRLNRIECASVFILSFRSMWSERSALLFACSLRLTSNLPIPSAASLDLTRWKRFEHNLTTFICSFISASRFMHFSWILCCYYHYCVLNANLFIGFPGF